MIPQLWIIPQFSVSHSELVAFEIYNNGIVETPPQIR